MAKIYILLGHSLGGAMAILAAARCARLPETANPAGLYTYGSPKVGNKTYASYVKNFFIPGARWVNNVDIVTKVPLWPYKHTSHSTYLNHEGFVKKYTNTQVIIDRLKGAIIGLRRGKINYFLNHGCQKYIDNIQKNIKYNESGE